jgi:plastocyanin
MHLPRRLARLTPVLLAAVVLACGGSAPSAQPVATSVVGLPRSYRFEPAAITVPVRTTVTWTNSDNFTHTVRLKASGEIIGQMAPTESVTYTFEVAGVFAYDCSLHPSDMQGTVLVTEAGA